MQQILSIHLSGHDLISIEPSDRHPGKASVRIQDPHYGLPFYVHGDRTQLRRLADAIYRHLRVDRVDIAARPVPTEACTGSESLEAMALADLKEQLTEAAQACGIDPDGMDDGSVIRALSDRARGCEEPAHVHTRDCYDDAGPGAGGVSLICDNQPASSYSLDFTSIDPDLAAPAWVERIAPREVP